jgi:hypothetical protein
MRDRLDESGGARRCRETIGVVAARRVIEPVRRADRQRQLERWLTDLEVDDARTTSPNG